MQNSPEQFQFTAIMQKHPELDASFINVPLNVPEIFGTKGQVKVKALLNGHAYRGSLAPMGTGCHVLGIPKALRKSMGKTFGDDIEVILEKDTEPRTVVIPPDLQEILELNPAAKIAFEKLSYTHRREHVQYIQEAKKPVTRQRRLLKTIENLEKGKKGI